MSSPITVIPLIVGHVYRAKKPARIGGLINDRQLMWMDSLGLQVQYDGPAVANGRHYPKVDADVFRKWASEDITARMPADGSWLES